MNTAIDKGPGDLILGRNQPFISCVTQISIYKIELTIVVSSSIYKIELTIVLDADLSK